MFSAIATLVGVSWLINHLKEILISLAVVIILISFFKHLKKQSAINAQRAAQDRARQASEKAIKEQKEADRIAAEAAARKESLIASAISSCPGSEKYRLPSLQMETNVSGLSISEFKIESHGEYTALDFETTGLSHVNDAIVEIGAAKVRNGEIVDRYHQYVNPERTMPPEASAVNHITDSMLVGKPKIYELLPSLLAFLGDDIIVCHNAGFDMRFLAQACMRNRFSCPGRSFDSMQLIELYPDLQSRKLSSFLSAAGIVNENEHSAAGDAEALARLMIASMKLPYHITLPSDFDFGYSSGHFTGTVEPIDDKLKGKRFVITGEIESYEREDFEKMIAEHGGKCTLKISSATDYLIRGVFKKLPDDYVSAKEEFALKAIADGWKVKIITPAEFFDMLDT